jgi:hypothetical protein
MKPQAMPPPLPPQAIRRSQPPPDPQGHAPRIRVSVKTSARDPALLVVRRLDEGKALPAGTREAWLVLSEPTAVDAARSNGRGLR